MCAKLFITTTLVGVLLLACEPESITQPDLSEPAADGLPALRAARAATDDVVRFAYPGSAIVPVSESGWNGATGRIRARCVEGGTLIEFAGRELIPEGEYTVWLLAYGYPGFDPSDPLANRIGIGALGPNDGSGNAFVGTSRGRGRLRVVVPAGELSMNGAVGDCMLTDVHEFRLIAAYHTDGMSHGPTPGPAGTVFNHIGLSIVNDPPPVRPVMNREILNLAYPGDAVEPVTEARWRAVRGRTLVQCVRGGTRIKLRLRRLIPNGVYTIWNLVFAEPGFDDSNPSLNRVGIGALGPNDGSGNTFVASERGRGELDVFVPAGPMSMSGEVGPCLLTSAFEFHLVGAYHTDRESHGPVPGPAGTSFNQFGFVFVND